MQYDIKEEEEPKKISHVGLSHNIKNLLSNAENLDDKKDTEILKGLRLEMESFGERLQSYIANSGLLNLVQKTCKTNSDLDKALEILRNDRQMLYIRRVALYATIDIEMLENLAIQSEEHNKNEEKKIIFHPEQVILNNEKQKLVIICKNNKFLYDINTRITTYFNQNVKIRPNNDHVSELTINDHLYDNHDRAHEAYLEFIKYGVIKCIRL